MGYHSGGLVRIQWNEGGTAVGFDDATLNYWCCCGREFRSAGELDSRVVLTAESGTNTERHDHGPTEV